jgi:GNAT superfamily N-acetyltransferase
MTVLAVDAELRLRPFAGEEDVDAAWPWYCDRETVDLVDGPGSPIYTRARVAAMYDALAKQGEVYVVERHLDGGWRPIGDVTLAPHTLPIVLAPLHRGQGVGRRVILRLADRARELGWQHLQVREVLPGNVASHRLFAGLGFVPLGDEIPAAYVLPLASMDDGDGNGTV